MDFLGLFFGVFDFVKFLVLLTIVSFVLYKLLTPLKDKLVKRFSLNWIKSSLAMNFISIFVVLFIFYLYFIFVGVALAVPQGEGLDFDLWENILLVLIGTVRIIVATIILSLVLLFFEFVASITISYQDKKKYSKTIKEFIGVLVACAIFLILFLFVFNWVALGLFIYIFYGGVSSLPLLVII